MADTTYASKDAVYSDLEVASGLTLPATAGPQVERALVAATRLIDNWKRVQPLAYIASSDTRYYFGSGNTVQQIDYCTGVTTVSVEETDGTYTEWTLGTDFYLWPYNAPALGEPYRALEVTGKSGSTKSVWIYGPQRVQVVGTFGISDKAPADIERACIIQVARWFSRAAQGWQDSGGQAEFGQVQYTQALDPDVRTLLRAAFPHRARR